MENYWKYSPGFFETNLKEVQKLEKHGAWNDEVHKRNMVKVQNKWPEKNAVDMTLRKVPEKRNRWDSAILIVIKSSSGKFWAKRFNNSQWLRLEW